MGLGTMHATAGRGETALEPHGKDDRHQSKLLTLLDRRTVATKVQVGNWEEAVKAGGTLLLDVGAICPSYIEAMKDIIKTYGPYPVVAPGVALLHARPQDGVCRLGLSLVTLSTPVEFGHEDHDPVSVVFSLATPDDRAHLAALGQLATLIQKQGFVRDLENAQDSSKALEVIAHALESVTIDDQLLLS
jgi:PTS system ascorbate-specific IIA component